MFQLQSRLYNSPDKFVDDFLLTLTPGVIPRENFIKWQAIEQKVKRLDSSLEFFKEIQLRISGGKDFEKETADSLLAVDEPLPYIRCAFELLGHTGQEFVTKEDYFQFTDLAQAIKSGDEEQALYLTNLLAGLGFKKILIREDLDDILLGVQIGLETNRRKNVGGQKFREEVFIILQELALKVSISVKKKVIVLEEDTTVYGNDLSKQVDFVIQINGINRFGVEVNFYTVSGSKPTEIKRSYGDVRRGLSDVGVDLIWITDGKGYFQMRRSLRDAYVIFPNIYNLNQAKANLAEDLIRSLATK